MQRYLALQKIVELGSFTRAAESLGYTQSSMSQMIASLEHELSIKLLNRSRTGATLTLEGAELYPFIERTIFQYQSIGEKAAEIRGLETGIIRMGTFASLTCHWMPQLIKGFQQLYPHVQFLFHQGDYKLIPEWIRIGEIDFGFVTPPAIHDLETVFIKEGEMRVVLPKDHPLASHSSIHLTDIANEPIILLEEGDYNEALEAFRAAGITPNIKYIVHDDYAIMTMAEAGLGIGILAELVLRRTSYDIVSLPLDPPLHRQLAIGYKDENSLPMASKKFIQYIKEHAATLP